jgi:hypothetical protein
MALKYDHHGDIVDRGRIVLDGAAESLRESWHVHHLGSRKSSANPSATSSTIGALA